MQGLEREAAELLLFILASSAGSNVSAEISFKLEGSRAAVLDRDEAAVLLARLPVPVRCNAKYRDGLLVIECHPFAEPLQIEFFERSVALLRRSWDDELRRAGLDPDDNPSLLFLSDAGEALCSFRAFAAVLSRYEFEHSEAALTEDEGATARAAKRGASLAVRIGR